MSRNDMAKYNLIAVAATSAPMLLVGLGPALLGSGPRLSMAAGVDDAEDTGMNAARKLNERERAAMARLEEPPAGGDIASPFRPTPVQEMPETQPDSTAPIVTPSGLARPEVSVKTIVRQSDGTSRALIGGKLLVAGDAVASGWAIESIDAGTRSVTFVSRDGQRFSISLK